MARCDIVVVGGSAGALEGLVKLLSGLPARFPAAVFVVIHSSPDSAGMLPQVLGRAGHLRVDQARDGEKIENRRVYIAPPNRHLLVGHGRVQVTRGPKENGFRPAIDPLFYTAASAYGPRVVGVLLSGAMDDGTYGLMVIKEHGGTAVVQHPEEALVPMMPMSAIQNVEVDHIVRAKEMPRLLGQLVRESAEDEEGPAVAKQEPGAMTPALQPWGAHTEKLNGAPSVFTCPECGGSLWELTEGNVLRFRCHTGHGFSTESLLTLQDGHLENALWTAARVLQERAVLRRQLAERASDRGLDRLANDYLSQAEDSEKKAGVLRELLSQNGPAIKAAEAAASKTKPKLRRKPARPKR